MVGREGDLISGWKNKLQAALAAVTPSRWLPNNIAGWQHPGQAKKHIARQRRRDTGAVALSGTAGASTAFPSQQIPFAHSREYNHDKATGSRRRLRAHCGGGRRSAIGPDR